MAAVRIGSDFVRAPSFLEQRDLSGGFAQAMPQLTRFDEGLQEALLAPEPHAGDQAVWWTCVVAAVVVLVLIVAGCV